mmetsp:Transcript_98995/g.170460  ORF Transcript_98995/g.170460 Transcript_98995/m.170460 type:complete len:162 (-) Transcript_98995:310-795(-)
MADVADEIIMSIDLPIFTYPCRQAPPAADSNKEDNDALRVLHRPLEEISSIRFTSSIEEDEPPNNNNPILTSSPHNTAQLMSLCATTGHGQSTSLPAKLLVLNNLTALQQASGSITIKMGPRTTLVSGMSGSWWSSSLASGNLFGDVTVTLQSLNSDDSDV